MSALRKPLPLSIEQPIDCPCCGQATSTPTLDVILVRQGVSKFQAKILEALWKTRGHPITSERIIDRLFEDDPDGGPSVEKAYASFKEALLRLRNRLAGSGIEIVHVGRLHGYRLKINQPSNGEMK